MLVQVTLLDAMPCLGRRASPRGFGWEGSTELAGNRQVYNTEREKRLILKG